VVVLSLGAVSTGCPAFAGHDDSVLRKTFPSRASLENARYAAFVILAIWTSAGAGLPNR
jgi:hypothetical protein